jgi:E3 ubiquitin-protein ligase BRE1
MMTKRDAENTRLRDQRDQQAAELNERKQRDGVKFASTKELESLAEARSVSHISYTPLLYCDFNAP